MTAKTKQILPVMVAIFALMFVAVTPSVVAEEDVARHDWPFKHKKHMPILVEGFEGSIPITEDSTRKELKEQVTVSLSEAAEGLEVYKATLGSAINENGDKFLVWVLLNVEKVEDSRTAIATIYIVDAGDASNTAVLTREVDLPKDRPHVLQRLVNNIDKIEERLSEPTGNDEIDELRAEMIEKIHELADAHESGDSEKVRELAQELKDLRQQIKEIKNS